MGLGSKKSPGTKHMHKASRLRTAFNTVNSTELVREFDAATVAHYMYTDKDGKLCGYRTSFKRKVAMFINKTRIPIVEISRHLQLDRRTVMTWCAMFTSDKLQDTIRDQLSISTGKAPVMSKQTFSSAVTEAYKSMDRTEHVELRKFVCGSIDANLSELEKIFSKDDGDSAVIPYFLVTCMTEVRGTEGYINLKTSLERQQATPVPIEPVKEKAPTEPVSDISVREHYQPHVQNLLKVSKLSSLYRMPVFKFDDKPRNADDVLWSIRHSTEFATYANAHTALGAACGYSAGYIGPHIAKRSVPVAVRRMVSEQIYHHFATDTFYLLDNRLWSYIKSNKLEEVVDPIELINQLRDRSNVIDFYSIKMLSMVTDTSYDKTPQTSDPVKEEVVSIEEDDVPKPVDMAVLARDLDGDTPYAPAELAHLGRDPSIESNNSSVVIISDDNKTDTDITPACGLDAPTAKEVYTFAYFIHRLVVTGAADEVGAEQMVDKIDTLSTAEIRAFNKISGMLICN